MRIVEDQVQDQGQDTLSASQRSELSTILGGLQGALVEMDELLKYSSLVSTGVLSFDRFMWAKEDIARLRGRVVSNTALLTAFNTTLTK